MGKVGYTGENGICGLRMKKQGLSRDHSVVIFFAVFIAFLALVMLALVVIQRVRLGGSLDIYQSRLGNLRTYASKTATSDFIDGKRTMKSELCDSEEEKWFTDSKVGLGFCYKTAPSLVVDTSVMPGMHQVLDGLVTVFTTTPQLYTTIPDGQSVPSAVFRAHALTEEAVFSALKKYYGTFGTEPSVQLSAIQIDGVPATRVEFHITYAQTELGEVWAYVSAKDSGLSEDVWIGGRTSLEHLFTELLDSFDLSLDS